MQIRSWIGIQVRVLLDSTLFEDMLPDNRRAWFHIGAPDIVGSPATVSPSSVASITSRVSSTRLETEGVLIRPSAAQPAWLNLQGDQYVQLEASGRALKVAPRFSFPA